MCSVIQDTSSAENELVPDMPGALAAAVLTLVDAVVGHIDVDAGPAPPSP